MNKLTKINTQVREVFPVHFPTENDRKNALRSPPLDWYVIHKHFLYNLKVKMFTPYKMSTSEMYLWHLHQVNHVTSDTNMERLTLNLGANSKKRQSMWSLSIPTAQKRPLHSSQQAFIRWEWGCDCGFSVISFSMTHLKRGETGCYERRGFSLLLSGRIDVIKG